MRDLRKATGIHEITIPEEALDVTDCTEDAVFSLNIKDYLPENVSLANRSASGRLTVTVGIEKEYESELQIKGIKYSFPVCRKAIPPKLWI